MLWVAWFTLAVVARWTNPALSLISNRLLIVALYEGCGIPLDKALAAYSFKLSADQGHTQAQANYAFILYHSDGIPVNKSLAAHYFKFSADQGLAETQLNYGMMLSHGRL
jgi:TPR repeat protein